MSTFTETLSPTERAFYKIAFNFHLSHTEGATEATAHQAGLNELQRQKKLRKVHSKPQIWVDLSTGEKHKANY